MAARRRDPPARGLLGRVWAARPVRVVEDTSDLVAVYMAPGTWWKRPVGAHGAPLRMQDSAWELADVQRTGNAALRLFQPGRAHSILLWWEPESWAFQGRYVNLEQPMRRTRLGFDYLDQVLDIVVAPDRSSWRWKDEDELALAVERGLISRASADAFRREGERVIADLEANRDLFSQHWENWRPEAGWDPVQLPAHWDAIDDDAPQAYG